MIKKHKNRQKTHHILLLFGAAFTLHYIPFINIPFTWINTYFHEISHGLTALLTGGSIVRIELNISGSGLCVSRGGIAFLITNAGYIGATIWGYLIYEMADELSPKNTNRVAAGIAILIALTTLLYARDTISWLILGALCALFLSILKLRHATLMKSALKFIGIYVLLDAIRSPLYLIDGRDIGDAAALAKSTFLPEIVWILLWFCFALFAAYHLYKHNK